MCYAPFNSLRFSLSGNIYSCCYNRYQSLGRYPEVTVRQAWNDIKANELRNALESYDLSLGCHACFTKFTNKNYYSVGARIYDGYKVQKQGPSLMEFEISNVCNLECVMCNGENSSLIRKNREKGEPYPILYDEAFIDQLKEFIPYLREARFVGGEPFLSNLYFNIWETIININPKTKISILTNGTILHEKILNLYKNHNVHISFSIDSIIKETYEKIRINAHYEEVMQNFQTIYQLSKILKKDISVNICPIKLNMWEIPEMIDYYSNLGVCVFLHTVVYPASLSLSMLSNKELSEYVDYLNIAMSKFRYKINFQAFKDFIILIKGWQKNAALNDNIIDSSIYDLKQKLKEKVIDILGSKTWNDLLTIIESIDNTDLQRKAFIGLLSLDVGYIKAELENNSFEQIKNRLLNI
ncbi:MAG: hypothetical protein Fur0028_00750 [Bacteroidales bacterium]